MEESCASEREKGLLEAEAGLEGAIAAMAGLEGEQSPGGYTAVNVATSSS